MTHKIIAVLSCRETCEVKIFRENFQVPAVRARQGCRQALLYRSIGRYGQRIAIEHQHHFFLGAKSFYRHADGSVERRNPEQREKCRQSESSRQDEHDTGVQFPAEVDPHFPVTKHWQCVAKSWHRWLVAEIRG